MSIVFRNVSKSFAGVTVLNSLNLTLEEEKISCFLGPSGIGKTTILNIIAGLLLPDSGQLEQPFAGSISYLFQESLLLPWMNVHQNICYLMEETMHKSEKEKLADSLVQAMELDGFAKHYPPELSGGMARRTALARALACPAPLLMMDEPFASLDSQLKTRIIDRVKENIRRQNRTAIVVTHDENTAARIADSIYYFEKGNSGILVLQQESV